MYFFLVEFWECWQIWNIKQETWYVEQWTWKLTGVCPAVVLDPHFCFLLSEIAQVTSAYAASGAEQLSLAPGQLILILKKNTSGWWQGELQVMFFSR